jgi:hypothetical protein
MKTENIIKALGLANGYIFQVIKDAEAAQVSRNDIPSILALWCEHVFYSGSRTFRQRVERALRQAGWATEQTSIVCTHCNGSGSYGVYQPQRACRRCGGKGATYSYGIPVTVRRRSITI